MRDSVLRPWDRGDPADGDTMAVAFRWKADVNETSAETGQGMGPSSVTMERGRLMRNANTSNTRIR